MDTIHVVITFSHDHTEQGRVRELPAGDAKVLVKTGRARRATENEISHGVAVDHPDHPDHPDNVVTAPADQGEPVGQAGAPDAADAPSGKGADDPPATIDQGGNTAGATGPGSATPASGTTTTAVGVDAGSPTSTTTSTGTSSTTAPKPSAKPGGRTASSTP